VHQRDDDAPEPQILPPKRVMFVRVIAHTLSFRFCSFIHARSA
jgi:hypothetical protein